MKKILFIVTTALIVSACGNTNIPDEAAKRKQLQELKQQVHSLEQQIHTIETELAANETEELVNIKTTLLENQKFEHFIEVNGKVEAEQDVDVSPESAGIIKEHRGELKFSSKVGIGTIAKIVLPLAHKEVETK